MSARRDAAVAALFTLSGASGLVFELVWVRLLGLWTGHSAVAVSLVVAAFLAGLGLGNALGGRLADATPRPLRAYAVAEALTGVSALAVTLLLSRATELSLALASLGPAASSLAARAALAFAVLLLPTAAMGATLPLLVRWASRDPFVVGASLARLYALNTLGAAVGCALAGFVVVGAAGFTVTALLAAALDLAVAAAALALSRGHTTSTSPVTGASPAPLGAVGLAALASGFASIACEVLWFRVLHAFVRSSTYAFTALLVVFLAGLVGGGALAARWLREPDRAEARLRDALLVSAAMVLASVALLGRAGALVGVAGSALRGAREDDLVPLLVGAAVILPPATAMGACLPLAQTVAARRAGWLRLGRAVGATAALNTLGGVAGSLVAGLVLVPLVGAQRSFALCAALYLAAALALSRPLTLRGDAGTAPRVALAVCAAWALLPTQYLRRAVSTFPLARVVEVREGRDGTVAVLHYDRDTVCGRGRDCGGRCGREFRFDQLVFGTVSYASTILPARRYMRTLAHLPWLAHPAPRDALQVCYGTGTTAGAFASHDDLRSLTVVDINRDVFALAPHFDESSRGAWRDPRVTLVVEDGRQHLATAASRVDVLSLEPPPPTAEGASTLYTEGFYRLAKRALRRCGVVAQWVPLDQQSDALDRAMLGAMAGSFRELALFITARNEAVVLGSDCPLVIDPDAWRRRWTPSVARSLSEVGFDGPEALAATWVLDARGVRELSRGAPRLTDDRPLVEHYRAASGPRFELNTWLARGVDPAEAAPSGDRLKLADRARVERALGRAWERSIRGDTPGALALTREALALVGDDAYASWVEALEFGCLDRAAP